MPPVVVVAVEERWPSLPGPFDSCAESPPEPIQHLPSSLPVSPRVVLLLPRFARGH